MVWYVVKRGASVAKDMLIDSPWTSAPPGDASPPRWAWTAQPLRRRSASFDEGLLNRQQPTAHRSRCIGADCAREDVWREAGTQCLPFFDARLSPLPDVAAGIAAADLSLQMADLSEFKELVEAEGSGSGVSSSAAGSSSPACGVETGAMLAALKPATFEQAVAAAVEREVASAMMAKSLKKKRDRAAHEAATTDEIEVLHAVLLRPFGTNGAYSGRVLDRLAKHPSIVANTERQKPVKTYRRPGGRTYEDIRADCVAAWPSQLASVTLAEKPKRPNR